MSSRAPAPPYSGEDPHALWHVSEDDSLRRFEPHRAATALTDAELVWAVDTRHLPMFWFPRECPRCTFWAGPGTFADDVERFLYVRERRVHAIESAWLARMREARVVAYRMPEKTFEPHAEVGGYWLSRVPVEPVELVELGDLLERHAEAEIELRVLPSLWPLWNRVTRSTLEFSGLRLRNAQPAPVSEGRPSGRPSAYEN
ncbi:MAG: DUF6886 family protein [Gaiellaceae bacterium]